MQTRRGDHHHPENWCNCHRERKKKKKKKALNHEDGRQQCSMRDQKENERKWL